MKQFELVKKGVGTVKFMVNDDGQRMVIRDGEIFKIDSGEEFVAKYNSYIGKGWKLKEEKTEAPQDKPETKFIWCKDSKRIWAEEYNKRRSAAINQIDKKLKGKEYWAEVKKVEAQIKADMKVWEAENAPRVNADLRAKWEAEKNAQ